MSEYIPFEQIPFGTDSFADNPEPRCPCVLLLDTSGSMAGRAIQELNKGIQTFKEELQQDPLATKRVEVAVITFGPVALASDFHTAGNFHPQPFTANGDTPLGGAIALGTDLLAKRKQHYKSNGVAYYKPWIILITDGSPTDHWKAAAGQVREGEEKKSFAFFAIAVEGADMNVLEKISVRQPLKLKGMMFREFFQWLSASMKMVSSKNPGSNINLLPPKGWTEL